METSIPITIALLVTTYHLSLLLLSSNLYSLLLLLSSSSPFQNHGFKSEKEEGETLRRRRRVEGMRVEAGRKKWEWVLWMLYSGKSLAPPKLQPTRQKI